MAQFEIKSTGGVNLFSVVRQDREYIYLKDSIGCPMRYDKSRRMVETFHNGFWNKYITHIEQSRMIR